jgi:hypothetical protein
VAPSRSAHAGGRSSDLLTSPARSVVEAVAPDAETMVVVALACTEVVGTTPTAVVEEADAPDVDVDVVAGSNCGRSVCSIFDRSPAS